MTNMERLHQWDKYFRAALLGFVASAHGTPEQNARAAAQQADYAMREYDVRLENARFST